MAEMTDMSEENRPYLDSCPVGCPSPLIPTDIILAEGPLLRCPVFEQLGCLIHGIPLGIFSHRKAWGAPQFLPPVIFYLDFQWRFD
jgi:hypothetical protein